MHNVLASCLEGVGLPRKSVVRLTDRPDMTLTVNGGLKNNNNNNSSLLRDHSMFYAEIHKIISLTSSYLEHLLEYYVAGTVPKDLVEVTQFYCS